MKKFVERIADGMYRKELMAARNKALQNEIRKYVLDELGQAFTELYEMDAEGQTINDFGPYTPPFSRSYEK